MPRDISGVYTLPAPMPVQPRTIPVTNIFNTVMADVKDALNNIPGGALAPGSVDTAQLADNSVTNAKMADNAINTAELVDGAVTNAKMANNSVDTAELVDGAVTNAKIQAQPTFTGPVAGVDGAVGATLELRKAGARFAAVGNTTGVDERLYVVSDEGAIQLIPNNTGLGTEEFVLLQKGQLRFPVTQNPSTDPNTLDDYEEGTWTPTLTFTNPGNLSATYTQRYGHYTKIGNLVYVVAYMIIDPFTHTTASGEATISGLPFTGGVAPYGPAVVSDTRGFSPPAGSWMGGYVRTNGTFPLSRMTGSTFGTLDTTHVPSGYKELMISAVYVL